MEKTKMFEATQAFRKKEKAGEWAPKFREGDIIVHLRKEGLPLTAKDIYRIISIKEKRYTIETLCRSEVMHIAYEAAEHLCVNVNDILWYWESQDKFGSWEITNVRYARSSIGVGLFRQGKLSNEPIYALGFRLSPF